MSKYHPIFDDRNRDWDLPNDLNIERYEEIWGGKITVFQVPNGLIMRLTSSEYNFIATDMNGDMNPLLELVSDGFWDQYIAPYIIHPPMIDMTGELDGDDIELAQIIMDELEEHDG